MNMNTVIFSTLFLLKTLTGQMCGPVNGIRLQPSSYTDEFKYACCAAECGELCGKEQCSSISSEKCCGSYITRTCEINGFPLQGCINDGFKDKEIEYCSDTVSAPCVLTTSDYIKHGYETEDHNKFVRSNDNKDLEKWEIILVIIGGLILLALIALLIMYIINLCKSRKRSREEREQQQNDVEMT